MWKMFLASNQVSWMMLIEIEVCVVFCALFAVCSGLRGCMLKLPSAVWLDIFCDVISLPVLEFCFALYSDYGLNVF